MGVFGEIVEMRRTGAELSVAWRIQNFPSLSSSTFYCSPQFPFGGGRWYMTLWLNWVKERRDPASGKMRLALNRGDGGAPKTFRISLGIGGTGGVEMEKEEEREFWGFGEVFSNDLCARSQLMQHGCRLMPNGVLNVTCCIKVPGAAADDLSHSSSREDSAIGQPKKRLDWTSTYRADQSSDKGDVLPHPSNPAVSAIGQPKVGLELSTDHTGQSSDKREVLSRPSNRADPAIGKPADRGQSSDMRDVSSHPSNQANSVIGQTTDRDKSSDKLDILPCRSNRADSAIEQPKVDLDLTTNYRGQSSDKRDVLSHPSNRADSAIGQPTDRGQFSDKRDSSTQTDGELSELNTLTGGSKPLDKKDSSVQTDHECKDSNFLTEENQSSEKPSALDVDAERKNNEDEDNEESKNKKNMKQLSQVKNTKKISLPARHGDVIRSLKSILAGGSRADFTLKSGDREWPVHRAILEGRSGHFAALFRGEWAETEVGEVRCNDVTRDALDAVLHFAYAGEVGEMSVGNVFDIYDAAHRFLLEDLKSLCVEYMGEEMCPEMVCGALAVSETQGEGGLKESALECYFREPNRVCETEGWKWLKERHPSIIGELFEEAVKRERKNRSQK